MSKAPYSITMEVVKRNFPEIMSDNDMLYFMHLEGVITSVDELCSLQITKTPHSYHFRIAPSLPKYIEVLLREICKLNTTYGIRLELSKSIKSSSVITFDIEL